MDKTRMAPPPPPLEDHHQGGSFLPIGGPRIIDTDNGIQWRLRLRNPGPIPENTATAAACPNAADVDTSSDGGPFATVEFWREQVELKGFAGNAYLTALLNEPWFGDLLRSPGSGNLWRKKARSRLLKELTESYAVLVYIRRSRLRQGVDPTTDVGEGAVIFDICCGQGVTGLMVSFALPRAQLVLVDNDPKMQLTYLLTRPSVQFHRMHLMAPGQLAGLVERTLLQNPSGTQWSCAVGIHLCGALSPRLIYEFGESRVDSLVLSPCCLKGWIGKEVQQRAKRQAQPDYVVLCDELCGLVEHIPMMEDVEYLFDEAVLSVKNGFVLGHRRRQP